MRRKAIWAAAISRRPRPALIIFIGLFAVPWYAASNTQLERHVGPGGTAPAEFGAWAGAGTLGALASVVVLFGVGGGSPWRSPGLGGSSSTAPEAASWRSRWQRRRPSWPGSRSGPR